MKWRRPCDDGQRDCRDSAASQVHQAFWGTTGRITNIFKPTRKEPESRLDYNFCKVPLIFDSSLDPVCLSGSQPTVRPDGQSLSSEHWKPVKKTIKNNYQLCRCSLFQRCTDFFFFVSCPVKFQNLTFLRNKPAIYLRPFKSPFFPHHCHPPHKWLEHLLYPQKTSLSIRVSLCLNKAWVWNLLPCMTELNSPGEKQL